MSLWLSRSERAARVAPISGRECNAAFSHAAPGSGMRRGILSCGFDGGAVRRMRSRAVFAAPEFRRSAGTGAAGAGAALVVARGSADAEARADL